jgi:2-keto-4-pentenoate hydratase/2-oxohepta-3-ene-1,7-dioic acid hydratase in catechol pathway
MAQLKIKGIDETVNVNNVFCIGKNYADHINEIVIPGIKNEIPAEPVVFLKPTTAIVGEGSIITVPGWNGKKISGNIQNEVELVIVIGKDGDDIKEENALSHILGYAVGIDFTLRDIQTECKKQGKPWAVAKGFRTSSPISDIVPKETIEDVQNLTLRLDVNGENKQSGNTSEMLFSVKFIVSYLSSIFGLRRGDVIFTGTPAGIAKLETGDRVSAGIENIGKLNVTIG